VERVAAGAAFCACAKALEVSVAAATSVDVPSSILRRLKALSSVLIAVLVEDTPLGLLIFTSSDIRLSLTHKMLKSSRARAARHTSESDMA